jgi:deoxyribose-phosphate aldolase
MLNQFIDHTLLKPTANESDYLKLCNEAAEFNFKAVCVPPTWVSICKKELKNSNVLVAAVVGFPLGYNLTSTKVQEIQTLISMNVDEIDFVTNISWVKSGKFDLVYEEYKMLRDTAGQVVLKAILETGALSEYEIKKLCDLAVKAKLDFIKTSTGFYETGARLSDVQLMKKQVGSSILIKSSGGIKDFLTAKQFINAGADRIGCSASVKILKESEGNL